MRRFLGDVTARLTVALVALPLSMVLAIASGTTLDRGLYTAIVAGALISALAAAAFRPAARGIPWRRRRPRNPLGSDA